MSVESTVHGVTDQGQLICRDPRYGWYLRGGNLIPMEEVTVGRAAIEALRAGRIIFGVPGGRVFDRGVRQLGTDPDFGEPTGLTAWDAAESFWRDAIGPAEVVRRSRCWEVGFPDRPDDPASTHFDQESGLSHRPQECPHA